MKKSEQYTLSMEAILDSEYTNSIRLEILETLMEDRKMARFVEEQEKKQDKKEQEVQA